MNDICEFAILGQANTNNLAYQLGTYFGYAIAALIAASLLWRLIKKN